MQYLLGGAAADFRLMATAVAWCARTIFCLSLTAACAAGTGTLDALALAHLDLIHGSTPV